MIIGIIVWLVLCIILANAGSKRKIGGAGAFFISLLLSPLIGFIVVMVSDPKERGTINYNVNPKAVQFRKMATKEYKKQDYNSALTQLKEAIKLEPDKAQDFFNLTCIYSRLEDSENGFKSLQRAVELGYNDFNKINSIAALQHLRNQPAFEQFALNGYKK